MVALKRILVPTDFSDVSRHARRYACACAKEFNSEPHLVHALRDVIGCAPAMDSATPTHHSYRYAESAGLFDNFADPTVCRESRGPAGCCDTQQAHVFQFGLRQAGFESTARVRSDRSFTTGTDGDRKFD